MLEMALDGIRILDLADEKGIYCTKLLSDLGAEVIRVEKPGGDPLRGMPPFFQDTPGQGNSLWFTYYNTNKKSITLNLETATGQDIFKRLCQKVDIIVETFAPGYLAQLGLGYERLAMLHPSIIMTSVTGYGQTGPHSNYKVSDIVSFAESGQMYLVGDTDTPPIHPGGFPSYHTGGSLAAVATLVALFHCRNTGTGQHVDVSLQECGASLLDAIMAFYSYLGEIPRRAGTVHLLAYPSGTYPCLDGYVSIVANRPGDWRALVLWIVQCGIDVGTFAETRYEESPELRRASRKEIDEIISRFTGGFMKEDFFHEGQKRGLAVGAALDSREIASDPHLAERGYFVEVDQPGFGKLAFPGAPYRLSKTPWSLRSLPPSVGQHNDEIYGQIGLSRNDLILLTATGVI